VRRRSAHGAIDVAAWIADAAARESAHHRFRDEIGARFFRVRRGADFQRPGRGTVEHVLVVRVDPTQ
jgi:hypothetical protein